MGRAMKHLLVTLVTLLALLAGITHAAEFTPEAIGRVESVPSPHPAHWLVVHDLAFNHMREGKLFIVDPAGSGLGDQLRGILSADFIAGFLTSAKRREHYVIESFHARGGRGGQRTDVVSIYDQATLSVVAEVIIPAKRLTGMPNRFAVALIDNDRFLLVYNFTPSQSISVVDLEQRSFLGEIATPGCAFAIPTGERGFSGLCSDGGMLTVRLDAAGAVADTSRTAPFNDIENDAMFEKPAISGGMAYFPTFTGNVVPIDLSGAVPAVGQAWSLTTAAERASGWRPGGAWPAVADDDGNLYVLMHADGAEGTHKNGGDQVWVFDAARGVRKDTIVLDHWGIALSLSGAVSPPLIVTTLEGGIDLYDTGSGNLLKTLAIETATPLLVHGMR